jgi:hypothetical protein
MWHQVYIKYVLNRCSAPVKQMEINRVSVYDISTGIYRLQTCNLMGCPLILALGVTLYWGSVMVLSFATQQIKRIFFFF